MEDGDIEIAIDCRSEEGVTIGLIDSLIAISRVLARRSFMHPAVREALRDLACDDDLTAILSTAREVN